MSKIQFNCELESQKVKHVEEVAKARNTTIDNVISKLINNLYIREVDINRYKMREAFSFVIRHKLSNNMDDNKQKLVREVFNLVDDIISKYIELVENQQQKDNNNLGE